MSFTVVHGRARANQRTELGGLRVTDCCNGPCGKVERNTASRPPEQRLSLADRKLMGTKDMGGLRSEIGARRMCPSGRPEPASQSPAGPVSAAVSGTRCIAPGCPAGQKTHATEMVRNSNFEASSKKDDDMSRGYPSMTALLGLLAIAGYQNRDKIAEMLRGAQSNPADPAAPPKRVPARRHPETSAGYLVERALATR